MCASIYGEPRRGRIKPILKWAGGKSALIPQLTPLFPHVFQRYFEPFFGGGAVFFSLEFSGVSFINDSNTELIELYETVRDQPDLLMARLDKLATLYSESFYYQLRTEKPKSKLDRAARTLFLNKTGFNGLYRQNTNGHFNVPFGKRSQCPALYNRDNFLRAASALKTTSLVTTDFENLIDDAGAGDFIYCDPPYEPLSRTSSFNAYQGSGFSQDEQRRLKAACIRAQKRGAYVVISNSSASFIKDLYADCVVRTISARRAINSNAAHRGVIDEVAVVLTPSPVATTGYSFIDIKSIHVK